MRNDGSIEFDYELDLDYEEFESFELPELSKGRYLHDFKVKTFNPMLACACMQEYIILEIPLPFSMVQVNQTAIIDPEDNRCFLLPLDRDEIPKPRSLFDIIANMKNGAYELDIQEIRHDTRVVLPSITDLTPFG